MSNFIEKAFAVSSMAVSMAAGLAGESDPKVPDNADYIEYSQDSKRDQSERDMQSDAATRNQSTTSSSK
jgi:hypothetical protein